MVALVLAGTTASCGGPQRSAPRSRMTVKQIFEKSKPAIVIIEADAQRMGTGFAVDASGIIATNLHVVAGAKAITVRMFDGTAYEVKRVLGFDADRDLALLALDLKTPMPALRLGDSDLIEPGDPVVAIGNPLGVLSYTVSDGLISSVRELSAQLTVLQISAPISQGSSGGPLFNPYGEVIGVATAIFTGGQNLNFAVPSKYLAPMIAAPQQISMADFAVATNFSAEGGDVPEVKIERKVPIHDLAVLDGCSPQQLADVAKGISEAIELGAPLYNAGNIEACFKIYEGTAEHFKRDGGCEGVRQAFGDGLTRATSLATPNEKAWALRDTFDGMLDVMLRKTRKP
jgi:hypothetical protein